MNRMKTNQTIHKMQTYNYQLGISATSETDAEIKVKALAVLARKLKATELQALAKTVANDPVKTALAKKYLGL